jgi:hypothetical protein
MLINERKPHYIDRFRILAKNILILCGTFAKSLVSLPTLILLATQRISGKGCLTLSHLLELAIYKYKSTFDFDCISYFFNLSLTLLLTPFYSLYLKPLKSVEPPLSAIFEYNFLLVSIGQS